MGTDARVEREPTPVSLLIPSVLADQPLHDMMGCMRARTDEDGSLCLHGELAPGLYEMSFVTAAGAFPTESVMITATEWPSRKQIQAGPFDLDHTQYQMAVPTFRVHVDGEDCGLVWCEVPSPEDLAEGRIRAMWGIRVTTKSETEIRLQVNPRDAGRLRWADVEELTVAADDRYSLPLGKNSAAVPGRPRVFANETELRALMAEQDPIRQALLAGLVSRLERGDDGTYVYRTVIAAIVGRLTGDSRWVQEAINRTMSLCQRPYWGYHDEPEIMGWNNDRDAGTRMYEAAVTYDWLYDHLTGPQRRAIREKLVYHAEIAYKATLLQKNYWYYRCAEAHGQGLWFGFAAAAAALLGEDPRAELWLEWIHGNLDDALRHLPEDGISEWLVFNVQWHVYTLALIEKLRGRRMRGRYPFLREFARRVKWFVGEGGGPVLGALLLYLAGRHRDQRCQADALRSMHLAPDGQWEASSRVDPFSLLAYCPEVKPSRPTRLPASACSLNGSTICRGRDNRVVLNFRCGTPLTPRQHPHHNWINRSWYHVQHAGSFSLSVDGQAVVPLSLGGYRQRMCEANLVTVDGKGNPTDGRWLGYAIPLRKIPVIEHFAGGPGVTYCCANGSHAYTEESGVVRQMRRWVFFHEAGLLLMHDLIVTNKPRRLAWHIHTTKGRWHKNGRFSFTTDVAGSTLTVRPVHTEIDGHNHAPPEAVLRKRIERPQWVPGYTAGLNTYKTLDWQPELRPAKLDIPEYLDLQFSPTSSASSWELVTLIGPDETPIVAAEHVEDHGLAKLTIGDVGEVAWSEGQSVRLVDTGVRVEADLVVRIGSAARPRGWVSFRTRRWEKDGAVTECPDPADLEWKPGRREPKPVQG